MAVIAPEDIVNQALDLVGYPRAIGDLQEGTKASRVALRLYGQVRDEILRAKDWPFARRETILSIQKSAGTPIYGGGSWTSSYPLPPFLYQYAWPSDALLLRYVRGSPISIPALDPTPVLFTVANDPTILNTNSQGSKVILTNQQPVAIGVYTGQILDPTTWEPLFIDVVTQTLAKKFSVTLAQSPDLLKEKVQEVGMSIEAADQREE